MGKSQASLEYLTTYAWAFIAISITLGALYYFGFFDFAKFLPQKCIFPEQFKCLDFSLRSNQVNIKLVNNLGENVCVKSMSITNDAVTPVSCTSPIGSQGACAASEWQWDYAAEKDLSFTSCSSGGYLSGTRAELKVTMVYYAINTPTKPLHTINGRINGKII